MWDQGGQGENPPYSWPPDMVPRGLCAWPPHSHLPTAPGRCSDHGDRLLQLSLCCEVPASLFALCPGHVWSALCGLLVSGCNAKVDEAVASGQWLPRVELQVSLATCIFLRWQQRIPCLVWLGERCPGAAVTGLLRTRLQGQAVLWVPRKSTTCPLEELKNQLRQEVHPSWLALGFKIQRSEFGGNCQLMSSGE